MIHWTKSGGKNQWSWSTSSPVTDNVERWRDAKQLPDLSTKRCSPKPRSAPAYVYSSRYEVVPVASPPAGNWNVTAPGTARSSGKWVCTRKQSCTISSINGSGRSWLSHKKQNTHTQWRTWDSSFVRAIGLSIKYSALFELNSMVAQEKRGLLSRKKLPARLHDRSLSSFDWIDHETSKVGRRLRRLICISLCKIIIIYFEEVSRRPRKPYEVVMLIRSTWLIGIMKDYHYNYY